MLLGQSRRPRQKFSELLRGEMNQATDRMLDAQVKQVAVHILKTIEASPKLSDRDLQERNHDLKRLVELYASDWEMRFALLTTGFMLAIEAVAKFFSDAKFRSPMEDEGWWRGMD